jgi:hypothetical protein
LSNLPLLNAALPAFLGPPGNNHLETNGLGSLLYSCMSTRFGYTEQQLVLFDGRELAQFKEPYLSSTWMVLGAGKFNKAHVVVIICGLKGLNITLPIATLRLQISAAPRKTLATLLDDHQIGDQP